MGQQAPFAGRQAIADMLSQAGERLGLCHSIVYSSNVLPHPVSVAFGHVQRKESLKRREQTRVGQLNEIAH
ncbi:hypothetical protein U8P80_34995 (plasmid) [Rhizobium beringeri]|nr:hypothetical protein U8P80_34995 [Rhizobium beringeri]WSH18576.1 hypothetical protein U8P74_34995 [Rhizobium beringeri]